MGYCCDMTRAGFALQAKLFAGKDCDLEITRVEVGSGVLPEDASPLELTDLIVPRARATSTVPVRRESAVDLTIEYRSDLEGAPEEMFQITEFGVFAIGAEGEEVLILYGDMSDYPEAAIPQAYGGCVRRYPVHMEIGPQAGVQLAYPAGAWLSAQDLEKALAAHDAAETSHADIRQLVRGAAQMGTQLQETVDQLKDDVTQLEEDKQDKLTGAKGQVVGFDADGNAVAQEPPPSGFFPQIIVTVDAGAEVTCAQGTSSFQQTAGAEPVVFTATEYGTWTLSAVKDGQPSNVVAVAVDAARQYHAALSFFAATITVTVEAGSTVTCTKGDDVQTATSIGAVTFTVHEPGTYTIAAEKDGQTAEKAVEIMADGQTEAVTLAYFHIYGATWDGSSTTKLARTDDAALFTDPVPAVGDGPGSSPFDNLMPWSGMVRVSQDGNELVAIPKYWIKVSHNPFKVQISGTAIPEYQVSPAHRDRGDGVGERAVVYIGRYECNGAYKSMSGQGVKVNAILSAFRSGIHGLGAEYWQADIALQLTWLYLYIVEYADWNGQSAIGKGDVNNSVIKTGTTDSMAYHTGRAAGTDDATAVQYRNIENPWGNISEWRDGIVFSGVNICTYNNPANFSDKYNGIGATVRSNTTPTTYGWIKAWGYDTDDPSFIYPSEVGGSETTFVPDTCSRNAGIAGLRVSGGYHSGTSAGPFFLDTASRIDSGDTDLGSRIMKLPDPGEEVA